MLVRLPKTWASIPLDRLIVYVLGGDWGKNAEYDNPNYVSVRCIRALELRDWEREHGSTAAIRKIKKSSLASRELQRDDIVVEVSGGGPDQPVGRTALIDSTVLAKNPEHPKICTNFFRLLRPAKGMNSAFLNLYLKFFYSTGKILAYQAGSNNLRNLKFDDYLSVQVPVPPVAVQRRIVAKIEELFLELEKGIESLKAARRQLEVYRQSVLKHAFEGKLTAQWRAENKDKLETPQQLLARIKKERAAHYEQQLNEWKKAVKEWRENGKSGGARPTRPKKPTDIVPIKRRQCENLPVIPGCWEWLRLKHVGRIETGTTPSTRISANYGGTLPFFKPTDLDQGAHVREARDYLSKLGEESARVLPAGTTLVTCIGATIGKTGFAVTRCATNQQINSIIPYAGFNPRFVYLQTVAPLLNGRIRTDASATTLPILNKSKFGELPFFWCSLPEQDELVRLVEERFAAIKGSEREIDVTLEQTEVLRQSILKKAFSGQLVAQHLHDEPASVLLARIRAEREKQRVGQIISP